MCSTSWICSLDQIGFEREVEFLKIDGRNWRLRLVRKRECLRPGASAWSEKLWSKEALFSQPILNRTVMWHGIPVGDGFVLISGRCAVARSRALGPATCPKRHTCFPLMIFSLPS